MATRWAVATGNWSNTATWNGGTLPTSADDVYADGKTVTIDQDITVLSLRTTTRSGGVAGGGFTLNDLVTVNATGLGVISSTTSVCLTYSGSSTVSINSNITGGSGIGAASGFIITGTSPTVNIVGNLYANGGGGIGYAVNASGTSPTINVTGSVYGALNGSGAHGITTSGASTINITGTCVGGVGPGGFRPHAVNSTGSTAKITVIGTVQGNGDDSFGIYMTGSSAIATVTGLCTGETNLNSLGAYLTGANSTINVIGSATAKGTLSHAVRCDATTNGVVFQGNLTDSLQGAQAVYSRLFRMAATNDGTTTYTNTVGFPLGVPVQRVSPNLTAGMPAANNVRSGTVYGAGNALTGTLAVPPANSVASGVPVDNTTGTAALSPADVAALIGAQVAAAVSSPAGP